MSVAVGAGALDAAPGSRATIPVVPDVLTETVGNADERELEDYDEHQVTPLELFFDLVFVFAITQVTIMLADDPTWGGVLRGMLSSRPSGGRGASTRG